MRTPPLRSTLIMALLLFTLISNSFASKQTPPLKIDLSFEEGNPALNKQSALLVKLTAEQDFTNLFMQIDLPKQIALISGAKEWRGALANGATKEIRLLIMIREKGEYSINAKVKFDENECIFSAMQESLNIIADDAVLVSKEPFLLMRMKLKTSGAGASGDIGLPGVEVPSNNILAPPLPEDDDALPEFLKPLNNKKKENEEKSRSIHGASAIQVYGRITYKTSAGTENPVRYAVVQVRNTKDDSILATGNTRADGTYSLYAVYYGSAPSVQLRVYAYGVSDLIGKVGPDTAHLYYIYSQVYPDYSSSTLNISLTTTAPVPGSSTDSDAARIFSVFDALIQSAAEAYGLRGSLMPFISVVFPGNATYFSPTDHYISMLRQDALDWDVMMHEYGHYVAIKGAQRTIDSSPGGQHSGGTCIPARGKDDGVRLAWSEGWATFFAIMTQLKPSQNLLSMPSIPNSGDRFYNDTEDATIKDDLETISKNQGYAAENSICATLYDLCDDNQDIGYGNQTIKDTISVPVKTVWNAINSANNNDVGKFYAKICEMLGYNTAQLAAVSPAFTMNYITPVLNTPTNMELVSSAISPTFQWWSCGDPTAGYWHNNFYIIICKNNFSTLVTAKYIGRSLDFNNSFAFSPTEWQAITSEPGNDGKLQWAILGWNDVSPRMPNSFGFLSNVHNLRLKRYHIRLRWAPEGVDIDLHLRPPSGASYEGWRYSGDCAYYNRNPDWGIAGNHEDDPALDRDCTTSGTEENITLDTVTTPGTYRVVVHYYNDHNSQADVTANVLVEIFEYGRLIAYRYASMQPGENPDSGDVWFPFSFTVHSKQNGDYDIKMHDDSDMPSSALKAIEDSPESLDLFLKK